MTVAVNDTIERYVIAGAGPYPYTWRIFNNTDLQVYALSTASPPVPVLLTYLTHYTVAGVNDAGGGSITLLAAAFTPYAGYTLDIRANTPEDQPTSIRNIGRFLPEIHEDAYDYLSRQTQDLRRLVNAKLGAPDNEPTLALIIPPVATRAGKYQAYDPIGLPIASSGTGNDSALRTDLAITAAGSDGSRLSGYRRNATGSTARSVGAKLDERISILDFGGNGNGIANNDAAFTSANTEAIASGLFSIYLPAGDYLVSALPTLDARVRLTGEGRIVTTTTHRRTWEYGGESVTTGARTIFVNPTTGNDKYDGTSATVGAGYIGPVKTLQRAWNMLPPVIEHRITIQMADGTYEANEFTAGQMERPAILWLVGKFIRGRTDQSGAGGSDTTGYVLFKGTTKAGTIIRTAPTYTYGIYASQAPNVGFDEMTLRSNVAGTISLLVAHRTGTYLQGSNIDFDGNAGQASFAAYAEAGGVLELTGNGVVSGTVNGFQCYDGSLIQLANTITVSGTSSALSIGGGIVLLANTVAINSPVFLQRGSLFCRGTDTSNRVTLAAVTLVEGQLDATFANFSGAMSLQNAQAYFNTCAYSNVIGAENSDVYMSNTPSFIAPAVASTVASPVQLLTGSRFRRDSATNSPINGSGGRTNAIRNVVSQAIASNGATVAVFLAAGDSVVHRIDGNGGNRINCLLAAVDSSFGGAPMEGTMFTLINTTANSVQIINSATTDIVGGSVLLGSAGASSNYKGITLVWENAAWREASRSLIVP